MESGLFILDAIVIVLAVIMSMRDDRAGRDQPSTSYFRHAEAAIIKRETSLTWRSRKPLVREARTSQPVDVRLAATRKPRSGRSSRRPTRPGPPV